MTNDQRMVDVGFLKELRDSMQEFGYNTKEARDRADVRIRRLMDIIDGPGVEPVALSQQDQEVIADIEVMSKDQLSGFWPRALALATLGIINRLRAAPSAPVQAVPDWRPEVVAFATAMESKLKANDHKGGWSGCAKHWMMMRIVGEAIELLNELKPEAIAKAEFYAASRLMDAAYDELGSFGPHLKTTCDPKRIIEEAADIANFAMMLADVSGALEHAPQPPKEIGE